MSWLMYAIRSTTLTTWPSSVDGGSASGVPQDPLADLLGQVQPAAVPLQPLDHAQRVTVVAKADAEPLAQAGVEHRLPDVAEGRVSEVVPEPDRLGEVLVQRERPGHRAGDAARLQRVGEPRPEVVALGRDEDLRLVLEAPERLRVHHPVPVALERCAERRVLLGRHPTRRVGALGERREELALPSLHALAQRRHGGPLRNSGGFHHAPIVSPRAARPAADSANHLSPGSPATGATARAW